MRKVRYTGDYDADLPTLGVQVKPGDVIEVDDDFENAYFEDVVTAQNSHATPDPVTTKEDV